MDIGGISMALSQTNVKESAALALMKMGMKHGKENADNMIDMLKTSVDPNLGSNIDIKA
ncbi:MULTISPECIES: YjfB family protein [Clostridium]|jgi:hypothetical protein|uniref:Motility protein n=1 Tax=Clostridium cochlearium TaxID=1494 RepID=A0A240ACP9_CLOCO|nr:MULTISPECIES: YjfB family protein [Clostridium]MBV1820668.1 YjfB family protein [Bacteroidales bacterium MSK.15.36]MBE6043150.1 putative motility protein [Clostridium thermopalmarium]MBE6065245.1 putative motility protein [Clostridium cochlearium]MBU5269093.1 YjfB family protein [Clostridium cochlearium]MCG4572724.1 YjfB family protein [Clostridium cochlearium]